MTESQTALPQTAEAIVQQTQSIVAEMNRATKWTMGIGYAVATPLLLLIFPALRNPAGRTLGIPNRAIIVAELLGAGSVTTAWFSLGQGKRNIVNVLWVIACTTFWIRAENKVRLERAARESVTSTER